MDTNNAQKSVFVSQYSHKDGEDVTVWDSEAAALAAMARDIRGGYWAEAFKNVAEGNIDVLPQDPPADDAECVDAYFWVMLDVEGFTLEEHRVLSAPDVAEQSGS